MASVFIATKHESKTANLSNDGTAIFLHFDSICSIGEEHELRRLDDYVYTPADQIIQFLRKAGATDEQIEKANPVIWFEAKEALDLVEKYIEVIASYHTISEKTKLEVLPELENFVKIFRLLVGENNEWHFEYDI